MDEEEALRRGSSVWSLELKNKALKAATASMEQLGGQQQLPVVNILKQKSEFVTVK